MATLINADTSDGLKLTSDTSGQLELQSAGSTKVTMDTSGNVGIGTASPSNFGAGYASLAVNGSTGGVFDAFVGGTRHGTFYALSTDVTTGSIANVPFTFRTNNTERMRIDTSGNVLVGTTDASITSGPGFKIRPSATSTDATIIQNTSANLGSFILYNTNATNNGYRFYVTTNGGIANYSGNNANLSDERSKKNIEIASNYLDKICSIPIKLFNYKDEVEDEQKTLGVIAQDVEKIAPEFVNTESFGDTPEDGIPLKSIYTTDLMFALMKSIQEQQAIIETLTTRIEALEVK
jgi:hypothetical protein